MTTAKQATTKKTTARKPAAKKTTAKKTTAKAAPKRAAAAGERSPQEHFDAARERVETSFDDAIQFVRDVAHTSIGVGLVVTDEVKKLVTADRSEYTHFLEDAKDRGHKFVADLRGEVQDRVEPVTKRVSDRFEPMAERIEYRLPEQVRDAMESGRERVRNLTAA